VETNTLGVLARTAVTNSYDTALRRSALTFFRTNVAAALTVSYGYDTAGRLSTVGDGAAQATYGYLANSALVEEITFRQSGTQRMKTTRQYGFNNIGNRGSASWGGNSAGTGLRSALYTNNTLNQVTGRGVPGGFDVMGIAHAGASVTVNSSPADYRRGEYFQESVSVANTTTPVWQNVAVTASQGGSSSNWPAGSVFVPRTGELFGHDTDGNLTSDGRWAYTWDGENRLVRMVANTVVGPQQRLDFEYDWQGRRIRKVVWPNTGGTGTPTANLLFVYDGWNLVAELNVTNKTVIRSYVWGLDLSGSEQGAGGVGGLLAVKPGNGVAQFAAYDGNGNGTALVDGTTGTYTARYEYGPFGEPIRVPGTHGSGNPFRFSTKYTDDETGLLYYGYRYYNPSTGRWPNRDPIGERGGVNLYGFVRNEALVSVDRLGLLQLQYIGAGKAWCPASEEFWVGLAPTFDSPDVGTLGGAGAFLVKYTAWTEVTVCGLGQTISDTFDFYSAELFTLEAGGNVRTATRFQEFVDGSRRLVWSPANWRAENLVAQSGRFDHREWGRYRRASGVRKMSTRGVFFARLDFRVIKESDITHFEPLTRKFESDYPQLWTPEWGREGKWTGRSQPAAWSAPASFSGSYLFLFEWDNCCTERTWGFQADPLLTNGPQRKDTVVYDPSQCFDPAGGG
jgi:RHS repeat-associated protein